MIKPTIKRLKRNRIFNFFCRNLLYGTVRLLFLTYRLDVTYTAEARQVIKNSVGLFYFWHQQIVSGMFFFYSLRAQGACVVSPSNDGRIAGFICQKLGFDVLYGSSHKASIGVARQALATLRERGRLCLVGDGSRGPAFQLQRGVIYLAQKSGAPLVFVECRPQWAITFKKSWDKFQIPLPFSKISVTLHHQVDVKPEEVTL